MKRDHSSLLRAAGAEIALPPSSAMLGGLLNAFGEPIDLRGRRLQSALPPRFGEEGEKVVQRLGLEVVRRGTICRPFSTGIRAIDGLLTLGAGQRIALLADPEAGADLLAWIARQNSADVNVILLLRFAPRALRQFIQGSLGAQSMSRSIVVAVLHDEPVTHVASGAKLASRIAHGLCQEGQNVLLAVDSGSHAAGSINDDLLSGLFACAGNHGTTAVTGLHALDASRADPSDPLWPRFDALIRLRRDLAERGYAPAIDLLQSWRRGPAITSPKHQQASALLNQLLAVYDAIEERLNTAAYRTGVSFEGDLALRTRQQVLRYLQQSPDEPSDLASARAQLLALRQQIGDTATGLAGALSIKGRGPQVGGRGEVRALAG